MDLFQRILSNYIESCQNVEMFASIGISVRIEGTVVMGIYASWL